MKGLILAAGLGTRLRPITNEVPKCMVKVNGECIIERQIKNLLNNGVKDISVVTGYKNEVLERYIKKLYSNVNIITNLDYDKTNNMYSLFLAQKCVKGSSFILMNSDVFYEEEIIEKLVENSYENLIVCEKGTYIEESMKIRVKDEGITEIKKTIKEEESYGTSIDVYKFGEKASIELFNIIDEILNVNNDKNSWTEVAIDKLLSKVLVKPMEMTNKWVEIDNFEDLKLAEELFGHGE